MSLAGPAQAFFGGSFDPLHRGHIHIARSVCEQTRFSSVVFVPNRANPLKPRQPEASAQDRLEMIRVAIRDFDWCTVSTSEIDRDRPSYTVESIERMIEVGELIEKPGMIIGDDLIHEIPRWHDSRRLLAMVTLIIVQRYGASSLLSEDLAAHTHIVTVQNARVDVSATEIRRRLKTGESIHDLVPEEVHEYIERYHPYH